MEGLNVKLDIFEGPLDLLLHLIKTLELDIYDIPIAEVTKQYMSYIDSMKVLQLEVAGEYIVMAATLMAIKSKMLLPKQEVLYDESDFLDEEDPRDALVAQLLEYRKYKYAATVLKDKERERGNYYTKELSNLDEYKDVIKPLDPGQVTPIDLFLAFHDILERRLLHVPRETTVLSEELSIDKQMNYIGERLGKLEDNKGLAFDSLFQTFSKNEIVTTFMALLELIKERKVRTLQSDHFAPIYLFNYQKEVE